MGHHRCGSGGSTSIREENECQRDFSWILLKMNFCYIFFVTIDLYIYILSRVRFHYGHPDVFDRLFHLTRGGVSKASKVINLSEDIFAGMP